MDQPVSASWGGHELYEVPPNSQGLVALVAAAVLERLGAADLHPDAPGTVHRQVEAMEQALAVLHAEVADPAWMRTSTEELLAPEAEAALAARVDPERASGAVSRPPTAGGTVYLSVGDREGMMVSLIQSNYYGFGSGLVVPGTGIALHCRGAGFSLEPGHPNEVAGGKRPLNTIIPGFLTRGGEPVAAFGVMGGPMQPQGHVQVMRTG